MIKLLSKYDISHTDNKLMSGTDWKGVFEHEDATDTWQFVIGKDILPYGTSKGFVSQRGFWVPGDSSYGEKP